MGDMNTFSIRTLWIAIVVLLVSIHESNATVIRGTDLFGSERICKEELMSAEPALWSELHSALEVAELGGNERVAKIVNQLEERLRRNYGLPYVHISIIFYFQGDEREAYITIDVVEKEDAERRLNFNSHPQGMFNDPDGLIAQWDAYLQIGWDLLEKGEIGCGEVKCRAFHSIFGHQHPQLAHFEELFIDGVAKNKEILIDILHCDSNDHRRASAAFLLAYMRDGQQLANILESSISDPSSEVRNDVLRVYSMIAQDYPNIVIPMEKILTALNYPDATDRNKAAAVIYGVVSHDEGLSKFGKLILNTSGDTLLKMMQLQQPNNSDWAYLIIQRISGMDLPKDAILG